jgi:hypothetical protein
MNRNNRLEQVDDEITMKRPDIIKALEIINREFFGKPNTIRIEDACCSNCKREVYGFRNELEAKEFDISGLCSDCQREFGKGE